MFSQYETAYAFIQAALVVMNRRAGRLYTAESATADTASCKNLTRRMESERSRVHVSVNENTAGLCVAINVQCCGYFRDRPHVEIDDVVTSVKLWLSIGHQDAAADRCRLTIYWVYK